MGGALEFKNEDPRCSTAFGHPFSGSSHARFDYSTEQQWTRALLQDAYRFGGGHATFTITTLVHTDIGWDLVATDFRAHPTARPITVQRGEVEAAFREAARAANRERGVGFLTTSASRPRGAPRDIGSEPDIDKCDELTACLEEVINNELKEELASLEELMACLAGGGGGTNRDPDPEPDDVGPAVAIEKDELDIAEDLSDDDVEHEEGSTAEDKFEARRHAFEENVHIDGMMNCVCARFGFSFTSGTWSVHDELLNKPAGQISVFNDARSYRMDCHAHRNCKLVLSTKPGVPHNVVCVDLIGWLAMGTFAVDTAMHLRQGERVKREVYHMKTRGAAT